MLAGLYLWSRGGAETIIRIEVEGDHYSAYVDGKLQAEALFPDGPTRGGIGIQFVPGDISSLPGPSGLSSLRVTAPDGEILFEDSFDPPSARWQVVGDWVSRDGLYAPSRTAVILLTDASWADYVVQAKLKNLSKAAFMVRARDATSGVHYVLTPVLHYGNEFRLVEDGEVVEVERGPRLELDRTETIRSILAMMLRGYPTALAAIAAVVAVGLAARLLPANRAVARLGSAITGRGVWIVGVLVVAAFGLLLHIIYVVADHMPHVPDSVAYVFQAKIFSSLRLAADPAPARQSFAFFHPDFLLVVGERWFSQYPFGHPLLLAVGQIFGAPWLIPPLLGAITVYLMWRIGNHVYGASAGLLAAVLLCFSPFFLMTASNFMAHNTAVFFVVAMLFLLVRPSQRRLLCMFGAGVFLGLLFNTRPLVSVMLMVPLGLLFAYDLARATLPRPRLLREYASFGTGALLLLGAYFLYNELTTGSFLDSGYAVMGTFSESSFGFSGRHSVAVGVQNEQVLLSLFLLVVNGWPLVVGFALVMMPFVLGAANKWDVFLLGAMCFIAAGQVLYVNPAIMHGPRYWYELMPFFMLLSARGAKVLAEAGSHGTWGSPSQPESRWNWWPTSIVSLLVYSGVLALVGLSAYSWILGQRDAWRGPSLVFVPSNIAALEGFNGSDNRLLRLADEEGLANALVFVENCGPWQCFGSVFWMNSPDLDTDIVWAEAQGTTDDLAVLEAFADRSVYWADYYGRTLEPIARETIIAAVEAEGPEDPRARPAPGTPSERDTLRVKDLGAIERALREYERRHNEFPSNRGQRQTLCVYRDIDAGCALREVLPVLPTDPMGNSSGTGYWYISDGDMFVVVAKLEAAARTSPTCPESVVNSFGADVVLYCVIGEATERS